MRIAIIRLYGSKEQSEISQAVKRAGLEPIEVLNESNSLLPEFSGYIIIDGSENSPRSGAMAALDPVMQVIKEQSDFGKPILGICTGAQVLVETGLVPGLENHRIGMSLTDNKRLTHNQVETGYYQAWVHMRLAENYQHNAFTHFLSSSTILRVPVAHREGRFIIPPALLEEMKVQGLGIFQYCDEKGSIKEEFPINPNGSVYNIAAVSNKKGNVLAMMPHPEHTMEGDVIFQSMRHYIKKDFFDRTIPLHYFPRPYKIKTYQPTFPQTLILKSLTQDDEVLAVKRVLQQKDITLNIERYTHWEIECEPATYEKLLVSGVLFDDQKECVANLPLKNTASVSLLVQAKDDLLGQQKKQILQQQFGIEGIHQLRHSVLWKMQDLSSIARFMKEVDNTSILFNPFSHDCYLYQNLEG